MPKKKKIIQDKKLRGEWAEMQFMARAAEHGLSISKPWGEMRPFDFVVGETGRFLSVQVKSTAFVSDSGYNCSVRGGHKAYPAGAFDFVAAYVVPEDVWYIIPASHIRGKRSVALYPNSKKGLYEPYREAWHLLREAARSGKGAEAAEGEEQTPAAELAGSIAVPAAGSQSIFPGNALERVQASINFARQQLGLGGVISQKREEEG